MEYEIRGDNLPVLLCNLKAYETIICQNGAMSWMSPNMHMETSGGGLMKMLSRALTKENIFVNKYTPMGGDGYIAFASSLPGSIAALEVRPGQEYICQKGAFLACTQGVEMSVHLARSVGAGFVGGEGFLFQRFSGEGMLFVEIDGSTITRELDFGEQMIISTGYMAVMEATCTIDATLVEGGVKNLFLGGEGFFNTTVTGPGKVMLQTMPIAHLARSLGMMKK